MRATSGQKKLGVRDPEAENERLRRELGSTKMDLKIVKNARTTATPGPDRENS